MQALEQRRELSPEEFLDVYLRRNRPVVLKDAAPYWKERWTPEWLKQRFGDHKTKVETNEIFVEERSGKAMALGDLIDYALQSSRKYQLRSFSILTQVPELQSEFQQNNHFGRYFPEGKSMQHVFWISPPNNTTLLHHDTFFDNLNVQIFGRKHFVLLPPSNYRRVYAHYFAESPLDPRKPDTQKFPRFVGVNPLEATLEPGDVIFIPQFWWHFVTALELCININTWTRSSAAAVREVTSTMPLAPRIVYRVLHNQTLENLYNKNSRKIYRLYCRVRGIKPQAAGT